MSASMTKLDYKRQRTSLDFVNDTEAGPGSYNIASSIGCNSVLYANSPRITISSSQIAKNQYISKSLSKQLLGSQSPGINIYSPNSSYTQKSESKVSFSRSERKIGYISVLFDRSPGPIYSSVKFDSTGIQFTKAKRDTSPVRDTSPSPSTYNPLSSPHGSQITIKGNFNREKVYAKNYERYMKGSLSPGPAGYNIANMNKLKGGVVSKVGRDANDSKK